MTDRELVSSFDTLKGSIVKVRAYDDKGGVNIGTGFLVHIEGFIVTAGHVVEAATRIEVIPENWPHPVPATIAFRHPHDLALLKIDFKGLDANYKARLSPAKVCARNKQVSAGADVGLAGYAWGMENKDYSTLFVFRRTLALSIMHPEHSQGLFYYLDGTTIAGMSGGPVFDAEEEVVGVIVKIEPEKFIKVPGPGGSSIPLISPEHLSVALQSFYIHSGLERSGIYL